MFAAVAIGVAAAWFLAVVTVILNLRSVPRIESADPHLRLPSLSVVIPARNEERDIDRCVRALASQDYPDLEVIVVDDQSTDRTPAILDALRSELSRVRVIDGVEPPEGWLGKPWALQQGGEAARSELLLFCDADVIYEPGALRDIIIDFLNRDVEGTSLLPKIEMRGFWEHVLMVQLPFTAFTLLPLFLSNASRWPMLAVGGGPGNLLRRSTWQRIGGHGQLKGAVVDDIALMQLIRHEGGRTAIVLANELVSVRMYHGFREIVRGFSKNAYHAMGGTLPRALLGLVSMAALQLFPYLLLAQLVYLAGSGTQISVASWFGMMACIEISLARLILFGRFGYRLDNALLGQPLMAAVWIAVMIRSTWRVGVLRRLEWRGRGYDARATRFGR